MQEALPPSTRPVPSVLEGCHAAGVPLLETDPLKRALSLRVSEGEAEAAPDTALAGQVCIPVPGNVADLPSLYVHAPTLPHGFFELR